MEFSPTAYVEGIMKKYFLLHLPELSKDKSLKKTPILAAGYLYVTYLYLGSRDSILGIVIGCLLDDRGI
jgi:hypothetical protein